MSVTKFTPEQRVEVLGLVSRVYFALLAHPHDVWRLKNQSALAAARDAIALLGDESSEDVQNRYEWAVQRIYQAETK